VELSQQPQLSSKIVTDSFSEGMLDGHAVAIAPARPERPVLALRLGLFETTDDRENAAFSAMMSVPSAAIMWIAYRHWALGAPVYAIGPRLQEMFLRTDLKNVQQDDLRMPYDTIYIALPDCQLTLWGGAQRHRLWGFFLQGCQQGTGGYRIQDTELGALFLGASCEDFSAAQDMSDDVIRTLPVDLTQADIEGHCAGLRPLYDGLRPPPVEADRIAYAANRGTVELVLRSKYKA